jgi:hypothetical protein
LSKITRDLTELFANPPAGAVAGHITPSESIQMPGLLGDTTGNFVPVSLNAVRFFSNGRAAIVNSFDWLKLP